MVEIDRLRRIELATLKPLFTNLRKIQGQVEEWARLNPTATEEDIILFRREQLSKYKQALTGSVTSKDGLTINIGADVDFVETMEIERLLFSWEYEGREYHQSVIVERRPSNLGLSAPVYYFICPYSGTLSRKLYTDGRALSGRRGFEHVYSTQLRSKRVREFDTLMMILDSTYRAKYRKVYYRGKLTPYGRRLERGYRASRRLGIASGAEALSRIDLMIVSCRRGRPRTGRRWR